MAIDGAPHQVDELLALGRELKFSPKARDPPEITSLSDVVKLSEDEEKPIRSGYQNEAAVQVLANYGLVVWCSLIASLIASLITAVQVLADLFNLMDTAEPDFDVGGEQL